MSVFRVPYPEDPEDRHDLIQRVVAALGHLASYEGTIEEGSFHGTTPVGRIAGTYRAVEGSAELEIVLTKKPWIVSVHQVEHEVRKFLSRV